MLSVNLQLSADTCELICEDLKSTIMIKSKKQNWAVEVVGQQEGSGQHGWWWQRDLQSQ